MNSRTQPPAGGFSEHNERSFQQTDIGIPVPRIENEQLLLDYLLDRGFGWEEAEQLVNLRDHLYDNAEMRQRMADDYRVHFARWLLEQGEISEELS